MVERGRTIQMGKCLKETTLSPRYAIVRQCKNHRSTTKFKTAAPMRKKTSRGVIDKREDGRGG